MNPASKDANSEVRQNTELYPGDMGKLPLEARRVLVMLLLGPSIDATYHGILWQALIQYEKEIRSRLSEIFLELVLDRDLKVAFTKQADTGELETSTILRRQSLTYIQSVLMLYLRRVLNEASSRGERAVVTYTEMVEQMKSYDVLDRTDKAAFGRKINSAIEKMRDMSIISKIQGSDDRYEISATLKLLYSAAELEALKETYDKMRDERLQENQKDD